MLVDGVFAITLTLLVIEIRVPEEVGAMEVGHALRELLPKLMAFALAFPTLSVLWYGHLLETRVVPRFDQMVVNLSILALLFVALVPFMSQLMGSHPNASLAVGCYAGNLAILVLIYACAWEHARRTLPLKIDDQQILREFSYLNWTSVAGFGSGVVIAILFSPYIAIACQVLLLVTALTLFQVFLHRHAKRMEALMAGHQDAGTKAAVEAYTSFPHPVLTLPRDAQVKNGTWLAVLLSSAVAVIGFATLGHSLVVPKLRGVNELIASAFFLKELVGFPADFGTTFAAFPDLVAMLKRRSSQGMSPRMAGIMGAFQVLWIWYRVLIGSDPVIGWRLRRSSRCLASHRPSMTIFGLQRAVP